MSAVGAPRPARAPSLATALALALGSAVTLGLARFSYALFLPPMRADLGWSYLTAGAMNTANASGYLVGALAAPACLRALGARAAMVAGMAATALLLAAHGLVTADAALFALRGLAGAASAVAFVAGGVLATQLAARPAAPGRDAASAGLVLGIYYGGTGLGIVASSLLVPPLAGRAVAHAWQAGWLGLGALGLAAAATTALATRGAPAPAAAATGSDDGGAFAARRFVPALASYTLFGFGYIGYMTFIVTLLREQHLADGLVVAFFALLGIAVMASPWIWARALQRFRGGETLALLSALLALATLLPVASAAPAAVFASGLLFGAVFLSLVASTTALVRHNVAPRGWPAGIAAFTIAFAAGQIVGPSLVGFIADRFGGLRGGLACSAALLALAAVVAWRQKPVVVRSS